MTASSIQYSSIDHSLIVEYLNFSLYVKHSVYYIAPLWIQHVALKTALAQKLRRRLSFLDFFLIRTSDTINMFLWYFLDACPTVEFERSSQDILLFMPLNLESAAELFSECTECALFVDSY